MTPVRKKKPTAGRSRERTRLLVMVDEREPTRRVLRYVAQLAAGRSAVHIVLAHLEPGLPPALLESGGAEQPEREARIEADLRRQQRVSIGVTHRKALRVLNAARAVLERAGVARSRIESRDSSPFDDDAAADALLTLARDADCDTIVVGHRAHGWLQGFGGGHLAEQLVRKAEGGTIWVVD